MDDNETLGGWTAKAVAKLIKQRLGRFLPKNYDICLHVDDLRLCIDDAYRTYMAHPVVCERINTLMTPSSNKEISDARQES